MIYDFDKSGPVSMAYDVQPQGLRFRLQVQPTQGYDLNYRSGLRKATISTTSGYALTGYEFGYDKGLTMTGFNNKGAITIAMVMSRLY